MRLATFNIFWLGTPETQRIRRTAEDEAAIVEVLRRVDADVLVLEEVVSFPLLEQLLSRVPGREYVVRDAHDRYLTTGRMRSRTSHIQKVALAFDRRTVELRDVLRPFTDRNWPGPRAPLVARLHRPDAPADLDVTLVGVHLKSGSPGEAVDAPPSVTRSSECAALATWLLGGLRTEGGRGGPPTDAVVVLGDLNAVREHPSLHPLCRLLPPWTWHRPMFSPEAPGEHWTSFAAQTVIDHALTSPAATLRVRRPPHVYAFDLDPDFDREPCSSTNDPATRFLRRRTDLVIQLDDESPPALVENLFRISDHRPVFLDLED